MRDAESRKAWREALARKYPTMDEARMVVGEVGLNPTRIAFQPRADLTWFAILDEADKQGAEAIRRVIERALADFPDDTALVALRDGTPFRAVQGPEPGTWHGRSIPYEKLTGAISALVPVTFLERGAACARAVARILCADGSTGTGFLVAGDLLVTNWHVLPDAAAAASAVVEFNYQDGADAVEAVSCAPDVRFVTSQADDCTIVKLAGSPSARWGFVPVADVAVARDDRVNVIQHPAGQKKQLSFFHNLVTWADRSRVQYLTDTLPGSSGAPVFDKEWRLVAVHHSGGWIPEPGSKDRFFRNEGVHVSRIVELLG